jgi:hypothetical protein
MSRFEAGERILEIKEEIIDLLQAAMDLMREQGTDTERERARGYWYAHIRTALDEDSGYMGRSMCTMEDSARELMVEEADGEEEDERMDEDAF